MKLSIGYRNALRFFTYYFANGTLGLMAGDSKLDSINYQERLMEIPSNMEMLMAIYSNNIEMDEEGVVVNHSHAMKRAAQFIREACPIDGEEYVVEPEFEDWEVELF